MASQTAAPEIKAGKTKPPKVSHSTAAPISARSTATSMAHLAISSVKHSSSQSTIQQGLPPAMAEVSSPAEKERKFQSLTVIPQGQRKSLASMATAPKTMAPKSSVRTAVPSSASVIPKSSAIPKASVMPSSIMPKRDISLKAKSRATPVMKSMAPPAMKSMAPPGTKSIFINPRDLAMASRQPMIENLDSKEREDQEKWAQELIKRSGACPEGFEWNRKPGGYQCGGGAHGVTDELLAEGLGGLWALENKDWNSKEGPYYPRDGQWYRAPGENLRS